MLYFMIALLACGLISIFYSVCKESKKTKLYKTLVLNAEVSSDAAGRKNNDLPLERLLKRNSKGVILATMLETNMVLKMLVIFLVVLFVHILKKFGILDVSFYLEVLMSSMLIIVIFLVPKKAKDMIVENKIKRISEDLPFIIDIMAICVQSGMTIENAIQFLANNTETINPDISALLSRVIMKMEVSGMSEALDMMSKEVPSYEIKIFSSTLQQSIQFGSSIYNTLLELSMEMREVQLLAIDEKVSKLAAKISLPMVVFIMFPILVLVAGPGFIRMSMLWS